MNTKLQKGCGIVDQSILSNQDSRSRGFTLVELAIVLVIVGLLIGGILAAQSMVSTANINAQVRQIGQFDAAVMNFKIRYNYLPGDAPSFGGDGDWLIDDDDIYNAKAAVLITGDIANFWGNLMPDQFIAAPSMYNATAGVSIQANTSGASKNFPASKIGKKNSFLLASALTSNGINADTSNRRNFYAIVDPITGKSFATGWYRIDIATDSTSAVKPAEALALDLKLDDGVANTGNIMAGGIPDAGGFGGIRLSPLAGCASGANYFTANSGYLCTPLIRIGGTSGDPQ